MAYQQEPKSYRDLPVRYCEFGTVYRNEKSGALNGLLRLRGFTQDDGHIFCTMDQVEQELISCVELIKEVMSQFDMHVKYKVSLRDVDKYTSYVGKTDDWDRAE